MNGITQVAQPVPLFYGIVPESGGTQELESGFDWVITGIYVSPYGPGGNAWLEIADESDVLMFFIQVDPSGGTAPQGVQLAGEFAIGPRTALKLTPSRSDILAIISGYALTPVTTLHV